MLYSQGSELNEQTDPYVEVYGSWQNFAGLGFIQVLQEVQAWSWPKNINA